MKHTLTAALAAICLLTLATPAAWAQTTTYASPVKIMNTPVPVSGAVTVTPQSGTMPVNGTVSLSTTGNAVKMAGAPFVASGSMTLPQGTAPGLTDTVFTLPGTAADIIEIEFISVRCTMPFGTIPTLMRFGAKPPGGATLLRYAFPLAYAQTQNLNKDTDVWMASSTVKIYAEGGSDVWWSIGRRDFPGTGDTGCEVIANGRRP